MKNLENICIPNKKFLKTLPEDYFGTMAAEEHVLHTRHLGDLSVPSEYESALLQPDHSYYLADQDGRLLEVGTHLLETLEYKEEDLLGKPFEVLFASSYREMARAMHGAVLDDVQEPERVWPFLTSDQKLVKIVSDHIRVSAQGYPSLVLGCVQMNDETT